MISRELSNKEILEKIDNLRKFGAIGILGAYIELLEEHINLKSHLTQSSVKSADEIKPKHTSKDVEEALEALYKISDVDFSENPKIARYLGMEHIEEVALIEKALKQALIQPKLSSEVEELFNGLFDELEDTGSAIKTSKLNKLKTKFAQMEQEIERLTKRTLSNTNQELQEIIWKLEKLPASDLLTEIVVELTKFNDNLDWRIAFPTMDKIAKQNQQYKQLLDEIELDKINSLEDCLNTGIGLHSDEMFLRTLIRKFKQLKSLGGSDERKPNKV